MIKLHHLFLLTTVVIFSCAVNETSENQHTITTEAAPDVNSNTSENPIVNDTTYSDYAVWKNPNLGYPHFNSTRLDTVYIGPNREIKSVANYFKEERYNVMVCVDSGEYIYDDGIMIDGENIILKGMGNVSILCDKLYDNVIWVIGDNIVVDNLHLMHRMPGTGQNQNCSGRVIGFDGADNITVMNCDLNGCGLAGLHDNIGNGTVYVEYNYIHNNSFGAYTDIEGNVWQQEIDDHPVFKFKNNLIENNGPDRVLEEIYYEETAPITD